MNLQSGSTSAAAALTAPTASRPPSRKQRADDGNQKKLAARPEAPRRHLFVVLTLASEELEYVALLGVSDGSIEEMPPVPTLPPSITAVWAGTMERRIYVTPPGEWQGFG
jgi:hypothetical protein